MEGVVRPEFAPVARALRRQIRNRPGGAAVCVYYRGECVVDLWGGVRDGQGRPWERDTMAPSFSTTKGVASTLLHILADRGLVDYDAPVARYWPEFGQAGKESITVRHVLTHRAGLYHVRQMVDRAERLLDWDYMIRVLERTAPLHPPGTHTGYHGFTYGYLVGEIIQRVTGRRLAEVIRSELVEPLGLDGLYIGAPPEACERAARLIWPRRGLIRFVEAYEQREGSGSVARMDGLLRALGVPVDLPSIIDSLAPRGIAAFDFSDAATLAACIPAANGLFTARSLARIYAALAAGGTLDGVRLLSPETLAHATQVQPRAEANTVIPFDMRWRLGFHAVFTTRGIPRAAFGHFGFGGSGAWACPRRQLAVALVVNSGMGTPFGDLRIARISGAALASVDRLRRAA
ncbi:MAG TPA: serine hydrolase domain-containing protein [Candidatus Limnocylindria bacterium]|nr:serine hydrolase domain-containing protein [Candidatus Limnocylindria bacterium]